MATPFRHLGLKVLSLAVALGLWFTLAGNRPSNAACVRRSNCATGRSGSSWLKTAGDD